MPDLKQSRSEQTKARILTAAEEVFSEKGLDGARVDEIAQRAGANKRMLYEYYGSKEDLYKMVLQTVYNRLGDCEAFLTAHPEKLDAAGAIRGLVDVYFTFLRENPTYVRMVMWENLYYARYFDEQGLDAIRDPVKKAMRALLKRGKEAGVFRRDADEGQVLMTLFACTFNFFSNIHTMSRVMKTDFSAKEEMNRRAEQITDMLLCYLMEGGK